MTLTESDEEYICRILQREEQWRLKAIISSVTAFLDWLANEAYSIYKKIKDFTWDVIKEILIIIIRRL